VHVTRDSLSQSKQGRRHPADPHTVEEIIAVIRATGSSGSRVRLSNRSAPEPAAEAMKQDGVHPDTLVILAEG
jgi:hypothetical protein